MAGKKVNNLSELSSSKVAALSMIFEDCTNALVIYRETLKRIFKRSKNTTVPYVLYELQNLETTDKQVLNEDMTKMVKDMQEQATYNKLQNDSLYVKGIMEKLKEEIRERGSFDVLTKEIERIVTRRKEEEALFEECTTMKKTAMELRQTLANEKMSNEAERTRLRNILLDLKNENEKLKIVSDIEHKYSCKWNEAKCQQNSIRCKEEWRRLKKTLDDLHEREKIEEIVSTELITFLTQDIASIERKIEEWQRRYDREKKMYEKEICEVNIEIETRQKDLAELSQEYNEKKKFIDTYLAEKEALKKQKEHEEHVRGCAIRIQAFWRGVMVRRKLGPYRPEEKKKKRQLKSKK
ncbi:dynein regulatory complex protein 9 isoform X2 [Vespula pensylvanica]|uniref:Dynein regulatory complex protein 9 n=1 Tax=Vespula pensylvanica TaxID=30213 RepID=A0A834P576_VESPE|nr:dynein regulatory complex protein 9 isoform X2 [Vespula pensylvanica]KAF7429213.1 hypothetical protein H0235_005611 [Vespula pensylvanica]